MLVFRENLGKVRIAHPQFFYDVVRLSDNGIHIVEIMDELNNSNLDLFHDAVLTVVGDFKSVIPQHVVNSLRRDLFFRMDHLNAAQGDLFHDQPKRLELFLQKKFTAVAKHIFDVQRLRNAFLVRFHRGQDNRDTC